MVGQKNGTEKMINDKTKLVKEAKNDNASRCWFAYQKRLGKMGLGEMRLGEMLISRGSNSSFHHQRLSSSSLSLL